MPGLTEVRWHARAGQGAKTASQLLALALLRSGKSAQAFPEYGPERRGAPLRAYTRCSDTAIRRHDSVERPDVVVVLEPSLVHEADVGEGLRPGGVLLVNATERPPELDGLPVICVPATRHPNLVLAGAVAAALGEPTLAELQDAAVELLGKKLGADAIRAAVAEGHACLS
jgi:pyruvate ferredoxin oxidoreductase gamma subunit